MRKIILLFLLISFTSYSQINRFTGVWINNDQKQYILKINIAQSNYKIYGTAEVINKDSNLSTGVMEITGYVYVLGERAQIKLKGENGISASAEIYENDGSVQFNKRGGSNLIPREVILTKLYN